MRRASRAARRSRATLLVSLPDRLRQPVFERTGGLHATGLFSVEGEALLVREDVGRHNAMDKVINLVELLRTHEGEGRPRRSTSSSWRWTSAGEIADADRAPPPSASGLPEAAVFGILHLLRRLGRPRGGGTWRSAPGTRLGRRFRRARRVIEGLGSPPASAGGRRAVARPRRSASASATRRRRSGTAIWSMPARGRSSARPRAPHGPRASRSGESVWRSR